MTNLNASPDAGRKLNNLIGKENYIETLVDEAVKWRLESLSRQQEDRLCELEDQQKELRRTIGIVTSECTTQFSAINKTLQH